MSVVGAIELLAWVISIALAGWMLLDMTRVARRHSEASLIDVADPLDDPPTETPHASGSADDAGRHA